MTGRSTPEEAFADRLTKLWDRARKDDRALRVLGDALDERGDPRGRFILLSVAGTEESVEEARVLLGHHRLDWLGRLAGLVVEGTDEWRGGLLRGFRAQRGARWPSVEQKEWSSVEWIDVGWSGIEPALPVLDDLRIPLRELRGVRLWGDVEQLVCRASPRARLENVTTGSAMTVGAARATFACPILLDIGTLELPAGMWGGPDWEVWRQRPPERIRIPVPSESHRELGLRVQRAVEAHERTGIDVELVHQHGAHVALRVDLKVSGATAAQLWLRGGSAVVGWEVLRHLGRLDATLEVVGRPNARMANRLDRVFDRWSWAHGHADRSVRGPVLHPRERDELRRVLRGVMDGSADSERLEVVLEHAFRTMDLDEPVVDPRLDPGLSDGVQLRDVVVVGGTLNAAGWVWMVDSQRCTPILASVSRSGEALDVELRFGIEGVLLPSDELDRMWRRGRLPGPDADWLLRLSDSDG